MEIRAAHERDLPALTEIYNHYVVHTEVTFDLDPFTVDQRREWFSHYADDGRHRMFVAQVGEDAVGYATSGPHRPKAAYGRSVETTVYLHPDHVGRGLGRALYDTLFAALADQEVHRAFAGVSIPNPASVALHRSVGFTPIGTFGEVGHKFGRYIDVAWFQRDLP